MDTGVVELLKPLGVPAALVGLLWWLFARSDGERRDLTASLRELVGQVTETQTQIRDSLREVAQSCREARQQHSAEHRQIVDRLTSLEVHVARRDDGGRG